MLLEQTEQQGCRDVIRHIPHNHQTGPRLLDEERCQIEAQNITLYQVKLMRLETSP